MEIKSCRKCGKEIELIGKGRPRMFCSDKCKSSFWQMEARKAAKLYRSGAQKAVFTELKQESGDEKTLLWQQITALENEQPPAYLGSSQASIKQWKQQQTIKIEALHAKLYHLS